MISRLHLLGKCYKINVNAPLLKKVKLPQGIYADCQVSPINFKGMYFAERKSTYIWSRSKDNVNWEEVYYERSYPVPESDIGYYLKFYCIPKNELGVSGPTIEITSENVVWEPFNIESYPLNSRHDFTNTKLERNWYILYQRKLIILIIAINIVLELFPTMSLLLGIQKTINFHIVIQSI